VGAQQRTHISSSYTASAEQASWDFGVKEFDYAPVAPKAFVVTNDGTGALTNLQAQLTGADAVAFEITADLAASLAGGDEATVEPGVYSVTITVTEGANYTAGEFEIDVIVIYDPIIPHISRLVTIEPSLHFDVDPSPGSFYVISGTNLTLTLTPRPSLPEGYAPRVTTNRTIYADRYPSGIKITPNADGTYTVRIAYIIEETVITISAKSPLSGEGDGSTANDPSAAIIPQVWGYAGRLYIRSTTSGRAEVYNLIGQLLQTLPFATGETRSQFLSSGIYIVRTNNRQSYKVALH
jgi:hypothetical protein